MQEIVNPFMTSVRFYEHLYTLYFMRAPLRDLLKSVNSLSCLHAKRLMRVEEHILGACDVATYFLTLQNVTCFLIWWV